MLYGSPIWKLGDQEVAFVGELSKWTKVSPNRFTDIDLNTDRVYIYMRGSPREVVNMEFLVQAKGEQGPTPIQHSCTIPETGKTSVVLILAEEDKGIPRIYCQDA